MKRRGITAVLQPFRSHRLVIRLFDKPGQWQSWRTTTPASTSTLKNCLGLRRERIDYSVHGFSCALHDALHDVLGCICTALRHVFRCSDRSSLDRANRDGEGENNRKQRFHSTK
jgi:hypothetical protein